MKNIWQNVRTLDDIHRTETLLRETNDTARYLEDYLTIHKFDKLTKRFFVTDALDWYVGGVERNLRFLSLGIQPKVHRCHKPNPPSLSDYYDLAKEEGSTPTDLFGRLRNVAVEVPSNIEQLFPTFQFGGQDLTLLEGIERLMLDLIGQDVFGLCSFCYGTGQLDCDDGACWEDPYAHCPSCHGRGWTKCECKDGTE